VGELAEAEQVEPPTMTRLVDGMERTDTSCRPDPSDARAVIVSATAKGTRALRKGRSQRVEALAAGLRACPPTICGARAWRRRAGADGRRG
jgi:DNA-binding MarR family transcriptional regulator